MDHLYRYLDTNTLARLVDKLYDEVCIYDNQYRMVYINEACLRHYGFHADDLVGKDLTFFEHDNWWDTSILPHVYRDKKVYAIKQKTLVGSDLFTVAVPIFDENNEIQYVVMSVRDTISNNLIFTGENTAIITAAEENQPSLLYESDEMKAIMETIQRVGTTDAGCLIVGESGTGKTALAQYMHKISKRKGQPFISVNCASLPRELVESELFGYVKGAFTGAKNNGKIGLFEAANHGTLLLDEISELPFSAQAKLLSAIQDKEILPVGATAPVQVDVKIVAATNKDLTKLMESNEFRTDLYYRLNVFELTIPPLRQRKKDIIPLATYFLNLFDAQYGKSHEFSKEVIPLLLSYDWKGNVRELRHVIERITVMVDDFSIQPRHLPKNIFSVVSNDSSLAECPASLDNAMEALERQIILNSYQKHPSTRGVAADLSISQTRASKLIRKYRH